MDNCRPVQSGFGIPAPGNTGGRRYNPGMADSPSAPAGVRTPPAPLAVARPDAAEVALVEEDLLVEEISIDGMCGVY
jgi:mycofactocin precursor